MLVEYLRELKEDINSSTKMISSFATAPAFIDDLSSSTSWTSNIQTSSWFNAF